MGLLNLAFPASDQCHDRLSKRMKLAVEHAFNGLALA